MSLGMFHGTSAAFLGGKWVCSGAKPPSDATGFYACCPSGWTRVSYGDVSYCKGRDKDLQLCGPLPKGAVYGQVGCDPQFRRWVPISQIRALSPQDILAPALDVRRESLITPQILIAGGISFIVLTALGILASR